VPFEAGFEDVMLDEDTKTEFKTTNPVLLDVISDEAKFCELYRVHSPEVPHHRKSHLKLCNTLNSLTESVSPRP
jgi:hypothetical protein